MSPRRIIITGTSCTGKTTLGRQLSDTLDLVQIDLDDLHFRPNWVMKDSVTFIADVDNAVQAQDEWIVSGSYQSKLKESLYPKANIIIWLDLPLRTILGRYFKRTFRRVIHKEQCCGENYETLGHVLFKDNMLAHIFKTYWARKDRLAHWRTDVFADKFWFVPRTKKEVEELVFHPKLNTGTSS